MVVCAAVGRFDELDTARRKLSCGGGAQIDAGAIVRRRMNRALQPGLRERLDDFGSNLEALA